MRAGGNAESGCWSGRAAPSTCVVRRVSHSGGPFTVLLKNLLNNRPEVVNLTFSVCPTRSCLVRPCTMTFDVLQRVAGLLRVVVEHLDGLERVVVEVLADQRQLLQDVVGDGDDVAADRVGLEDVEQLARAGPDQLGVRRDAAAARPPRSSCGTGSRPVSAMRPAKTETYDGAPPLERRDDVAHLLQRHQRRDVELHAGVRQPVDQIVRRLAPACWSPGS